MTTKLSLESIDSCLTTKPRVMECTEILLDSETETFLKNAQTEQVNKWDDILQKLDNARRSAEDFIKNIISKEAAESKLSQATSQVKILQQKYNIDESNAQQAAQTYDAQVGHVNNLESRLEELKWALDRVCRCDRNSVKTAIQQHEVALRQAREELDKKLLDKTNKEQVKIQASRQLQEEIVSKTRAENDLKELKEKQSKMETYQKDFDSANEKLIIIENMLKELSTQREELEQINMDIDLDIGGNINDESAFNHFNPEYQH